MPQSRGQSPRTKVMRRQLRERSDSPWPTHRKVAQGQFGDGGRGHGAQGGPKCSEAKGAASITAISLTMPSKVLMRLPSSSACLDLQPKSKEYLRLGLSPFHSIVASGASESRWSQTRSTLTRTAPQRLGPRAEVRTAAERRDGDDLGPGEVRDCGQEAVMGGRARGCCGWRCNSTLIPALQIEKSRLAHRKNPSAVQHP